MAANAPLSATNPTGATDTLESEKSRRHVPWQPESLRLRLTLWYGGLVALALIVLVVIVPLLTADAISRSVDDAVRAEARIAQLDLSRELSPTPPYWPAQLTLNVVDTNRSPGVSVTVLDTQGQVRYRSGGESAPLPLPPAGLQATDTTQAVWYTASVEGERVRIEASPIHAPAAPSTPSSSSSPASGPVIGTLLVGKSLSDVDATLRLLRTLLLLTGLCVLLGVLLGGWAIASRVLYPLAEIGLTARAIAAGARNTRISSLHRRIRRPPGDDELAQVVDTLNEMLAALDSSTAAQRRFVADASHELRAPLTTIQGNLAFLLRHADELPPDERHTMLADAHGEALRLARLVDDLLLLARADAGADATMTTRRAPDAADASPFVDEIPHNSTVAPVELDRIILQLVRQLRGRLRAEGSPLTIAIGSITPARVRADEEILRRIALILLDNAIKYASADASNPGSITVSLERMNGQAILRVRDTGIGIEPDDLPHIFERFYRADRARGRQGTGLGLAIAQTLVERLGGRITVESAPGQGSTFSV
ncbi:MAG TPA: HAMP domain-containing sensor histidine kinase, partial [Ktedonobacterales bacterium]